MSTFRSSKTGLLCREALFQCARMVIVTVVAFVVLKLVLSDLEPYSSTRDLLSGNADNISGEALNFTTGRVGAPQRGHGAPLEPLAQLGDALGGVGAAAVTIKATELVAEHAANGKAVVSMCADAKVNTKGVWRT